MANLLSRQSPTQDFPRFDPEQWARFVARLQTVVACRHHAIAARRVTQACPDLDSLVEELESLASTATANELLDQIERARREVLADTRTTSNPDTAIAAGTAIDHASAVDGPGPRGALVCYWPGRSLSTGEPNLASRGLFDERDRPPLDGWLEAVARPQRTAEGEFEVAIIAWIPVQDLERARAGCRACTSGSLALLADASTRLDEQLSPLV